MCVCGGGGDGGRRGARVSEFSVYKETKSKKKFFWGGREGGMAGEREGGARVSDFLLRIQI